MALPDKAISVSFCSHAEHFSSYSLHCESGGNAYIFTKVENDLVTEKLFILNINHALLVRYGCMNEGLSEYMI